MTPEQQAARRLRDISDTEMQERRRMYSTARGERQHLIGRWNAAWSRAGRPADFPDFEAWCKSCSDRLLVG